MTKVEVTQGLVDPSKWGSNYIEPKEIQESDKTDTLSENPKSTFLDQKVEDATSKSIEPGTDRKKEDGLSNAELDNDLSAEETTFKKRYGDQQRYHSKYKEEQVALRSTDAKKIQKLETRLKEKKFSELPKTEEELKNFAEKNPELNDIIGTLVERRAIETIDNFEEKEAKNEAAFKDIAMTRKLEELVKLGHTDAFEIYRNKTPLLDWLKTQSPGTQYLFDSPDIRDMNIGLKQYKKAAGIVDKGTQVKTRKKANEDASILPTAKQTTSIANDGGTGKVILESEIEAMNDREYATKVDEISTARKEGRIKYDLSSFRKR